ncbi:hypothetical protein Hdeb2414_s0014g00428401 [Helianthus debilis subsp. tardiflorus]
MASLLWVWNRVWNKVGKVVFGLQCWRTKEGALESRLRSPEFLIKKERKGKESCVRLKR